MDRNAFPYRIGIPVEPIIEFKYSPIAYIGPIYTD